MRLTINSDTTFLLCDDVGDVPDGSECGLYHEDTRFLSSYALTLDGLAPLLLAARAVAPYAADHFLTNSILPRVPRGQLSVIRRRQVTEGMYERIEITNFGDSDAIFTLGLRLDADFCHLFEAKHEVQVSNDVIRAGGSYQQSLATDGRELRFAFSSPQRARALLVRLSERPEIEGGQCRFAVHLAPRTMWRLQLDFLTLQDVETPEAASRGVGAAHWERHQRHREEMVAEAPQLDSDSLTLRRAYEQSVHDFARLQITTTDGGENEFIIAAGIPWFMTLFGRDSLITAYQALPFFPEAARGTLRALARLQGSNEDVLHVEEPGKILHEFRSASFTGTQRSAAIFPYYGTIDATPLFLVLLASYHDVTGDLSLARELHSNALRALEWMEHYGDRDGDGYLEYIKEAAAGLDNQGWKDSGDAVRFRDGRLAAPPIALCEVQGYAFMAKVGMARVFEALGEPERADALRHQAAELRARFNRDFWMAERGCYAFALDGEKRQVDALTSNAGQLLWTGIADPAKARLVADKLLTPELFSGWGVRTMSASDAGYNPISYHCGSVWPHDNGLIVAGLARYGYLAPARQIVHGLLSALEYYADSRFPELFAGYGHSEASFPVEYPTASRPQAWSAGTIFLLLGVMAGLDPSVRAGASQPFLPPGLDRVGLRGVWVDGQRVEVSVQGERVEGPGEVKAG